MAKRIKSLKSTFALLFVVSFLYTWNVQAAELPAATKAQLHQIIGKLEKAGAQVGLEIDDLGTVKNPQQFPAQSNGVSKVLFSYRATQSYMSASNWKLFTAFYALHTGTPDSRRDTQIILESLPDKNGVIEDNLYLNGNGDPSLNIRQLRDAAIALKKKGLRKITGDIVGEGNAFYAETLGGRYPFGWTLDDALWFYAPPISALGINRNQVDVFITGGQNQGDPATVTYSPDLPDLQMDARVTTGTADYASRPEEDLLRWNRFEESNSGFSLSGRVAPNQKITQGVPLSNPELMAAKVLLRELRNVGIEVTGDAKVSNSVSSAFIAPPFYRIPAPPLKVLLTRMLKRSDNYYAEMILRSSATSPYGLRSVWRWKDIQAEMQEILTKYDINTSSLRMEDGSGLSRYSLITPQAMTQLLNAAQKLPKDKADIFWNALPIAGVDGTLGKRMKSTFAQNNVRAKTGTFSTVCNLSGYVTTRDGHRLAVSFLINFGPETDICRAAQDDVFEHLAGMKMQ